MQPEKSSAKICMHIYKHRNIDKTFIWIYTFNYKEIDTSSQRLRIRTDPLYITIFWGHYKNIMVKIFHGICIYVFPEGHGTLAFHHIAKFQGHFTNKISRASWNLTLKTFPFPFPPKSKLQWESFATPSCHPSTSTWSTISWLPSTRKNKSGVSLLVKLRTGCGWIYYTGKGVCRVFLYEIYILLNFQASLVFL